MLDERTQDTTSVICPHCYSSNGWPDGTDAISTMDCIWCHKNFIIFKEARVSYSTHKNKRGEP